MCIRDRVHVGGHGGQQGERADHHDQAGTAGATRARLRLRLGALRHLRHRWSIPVDRFDARPACSCRATGERADVGTGGHPGPMCGRYASFREAQDLADAFAVAPTDVAEDALLLPPSWNLAPTDPVRIVVEREQDDQVRRSLRVARWGLVPGWAKDPSVGSRMINARVETLTTKPAFRKAAASRRCLVPAEGYFEWQEQEQEQEQEQDGTDGAAAPTAGRRSGRPAVGAAAPS